MGRMTTLLDFLRTRLGRCLFLLLSLHVSAASLADQPNILLIYVDDLGFGDLGSYGHPVIRTPNIDGLAREGMTFTNYYAPSALCSPSRAAVLTGRTPYRTGIKSWIPEDSGVFLRGEEITLAEVLKDQGYVTGHFGKWHMGGQRDVDDAPPIADWVRDFLRSRNRGLAHAFTAGLEACVALGADVSYHDPHIPVAPSMRSWPDLPQMKSVDLSGDLAAYDAAVIVTDHSAIDYATLAEELDTSGVRTYRVETVIVPPALATD